MGPHILIKGVVRSVNAEIKGQKEEKKEKLSENQKWFHT